MQNLLKYWRIYFFGNHHHHLFRKRLFPPCSARIRLLPIWNPSTYPWKLPIQGANKALSSFTPLQVFLFLPLHLTPATSTFLQPDTQSSTLLCSRYPNHLHLSCYMIFWKSTSSVFWRNLLSRCRTSRRLSTARSKRFPKTSRTTSPCALGA